ncbi:endonuclease/exonuclease/phosphatase family protein [Plantactinospora sp. CA-290183]|uniref:endonuclease/exonuclease/phosphatase family protein n=1 Tax=Plantactinospora sp. CA-290183 TaxID=3240006 RepID=UPI003D93069B
MTTSAIEPGQAVGPAPATAPLDPAETATSGVPTGARRPWRDWSRRTRWLLVAAALWLGYTLVQPVLSGRWWLMQLPDLAPPLVFLAVPLALLALAATARGARRPVALLAAAGLVAGSGNLGINWYALGDPPPPAPPGALRVVSWNTSYWHQSEDVADFYAFVKSQPADVYVLQEYLYHDPDRMWMVSYDDLARLRQEFPGYHVKAVGELVTLSRFPIVASVPLWVDAEMPELGNEWPDYWKVKTLRTDLSVGDRVLSVYNVHLQVSVDTSATPVELVSDSRGRFGNRRLQYRAIADDVAANPNQSLVVGDFNTSPSMSETRDFDGLVTDAIRADRSFYPVSWQTQGPLQLWRVDRAFTTPGLTVHDYDLVDPRGRSDHALQRLHLSLPTP